MQSTFKQLSLVAAMSVAGLLTACGGGGGSGDVGAPLGSSGGTGGGNGTLAVAMTDAPGCGYDHVYVTVAKVRVHQSATAGDSDAGWSEITLSPARKIDLLNLTNGVIENLGETSLAAGHYTQMRLVLAPNTSTTFANSAFVTGMTPEFALDTPSSATTGIKINNEFDVSAGQRTDLVLDFDACKSVVQAGNSGKYLLKPVVTAIPTVSNGITGVVDPLAAGSHVMITAQQNGNVIRATVPNPTTGAFTLARLAPGNYDVVVTADDRATTVIGAVPVASATSMTSLSTTAAPLPLKLATKPSASISGSVSAAPAADTALVSAKQTYGLGPTVTVKYQSVDVATHSYTLTALSSVDAQVAAYSPSLPLIFTTPLATAPGTGKYAVSASSAGYATQTIPSVDLSTSVNATANFTLTP